VLFKPIRWCDLPRQLTVEDDRDNSPLEEQIFGGILPVPLFTVSF
jgi:hypothetical protein